MAFNTGNRGVVEKLQTALEAFMKDHRAVAKADNALWAERTEGLTAGCHG
jgi:hypothetical protein